MFIVILGEYFSKLFKVSKLHLTTFNNYYIYYKRKFHLCILILDY